MEKLEEQIHSDLQQYLLSVDNIMEKLEEQIHSDLQQYLLSVNEMVSHDPHIIK